MKFVILKNKTNKNKLKIKIINKIKKILVN